VIDSIFKFIIGIIKIRGNTDGTLIGNISDRLKVDVAGMSTTDVPYISRNDLSAQVITASGNSSTFDMAGFGCLSYTIILSDISGTNPILQIELEASDNGTNWTQVHSSLRFTVTGNQRFASVRMSARYYRFRYIVSGATPSFTVTIYSTIKAYLPTRSLTQFRYQDVDMTTVGNVSTTFAATTNENITVQVFRASDGGNSGSYKVQGSNDTLNWSDQIPNTPITAGSNNSHTLTGLAYRNYRIIIVNTPNAGTRVLDVFWAANGGGA
jgi:hypothetical protein